MIIASFSKCRLWEHCIVQVLHIKYFIIRNECPPIASHNNWQNGNSSLQSDSWLKVASRQLCCSVGKNCSSATMPMDLHNKRQVFTNAMLNYGETNAVQDRDPNCNKTNNQNPDLSKQTATSSRVMLVMFIGLLFDLMAFAVILPLLPSLLDHYGQNDKVCVYLSIY